MSRTKTEIYAASKIARQTILDCLNAGGPMLFRDLAAHTGMDKDALSGHLSLMSRRGEIDRLDTPSRYATWRALVAETFAPVYIAEEATRKARETYLAGLKKTEEAKTPGLRVIRLLDKRGHSTGGQGAVRGGVAIQSGMGGGR